MTSPLLDVRDVVQEFATGFLMRRVRVLHGVGLEVPKGAVFGFLGPNGAGKTTLIQLIVGIRRPTSGAIAIAGLDAGSFEARSRLGYLPERPYFYDFLTGEQFLMYSGRLSGLTDSKIKREIPRVLELVGIAHARKTELRKYSKGMLQRVGIAQALLPDPELLVLDEPMSGLDPLGRRDVRELIKHLASQGKTIFFSTHVIPDVEAICDQVAIIQKGRIVRSGKISEFLEGSGVEIAVSGLDVEAVRRSAKGQVEAISEGVRVVLPDADSAQVSRVAAALLEAGGRLLWVTPVRPNLEEMVVKGT